MSRTITRTRTTTRTIQKTATTDVNFGSDDRNARSLVLVSWNISQAASSAAAPNPLLRAAEAPRLIRDEILRSQPDIIALQESASPAFANDQFSDYVSIGSQLALHTKSYVDLLVKSELATNSQRITFQSFEMKELPLVAAIILLPNSSRIAIASLHLPHTPEAAPMRKRLVTAIMDKLSSQHCDGIILAGDFNMRQAEDACIEQLCGLDSWKEVTNSDTKKKFTWNSRENMFLGHDRNQFIARFDRCYIRSNIIRLTHFDLIGNQPIGRNKGDYLSDHYGIVVKFDVGSSDSQPTDKVSNAAQQNADIRAARLQRFDTTAPMTNEKRPRNGSKHNDKAEESLIDLSKDSDNENDTKEVNHKKYKITQGAKNDLVDLTEDSDDEVVEIIRQAVAPSNDSIHTYAQQNTLIASAQSQSDEIATDEDHHISAATNTNDENDIQTESNSSEDLDNKVVVESKTSTMDSSCEEYNQLHGDDRQEKISSNDTYEGSSDNNIDNDASETSEVQSKPSSPASVYFASATAATPVWDNRTSKRAYKKGNRRYNFTSSSDEDDFDIMRAKLAKRKQASDSSDSEDDFNMMRSKLKSNKTFRMFNLSKAKTLPKY